MSTRVFTKEIRIPWRFAGEKQRVASATAAWAESRSRVRRRTEPRVRDATRPPPKLPDRGDLLRSTRVRAFFLAFSDEILTYKTASKKSLGNEFPICFFYRKNFVNFFKSDLTSSVFVVMCQPIAFNCVHCAQRKGWKIRSPTKDFNELLLK